MEDDPEVMKGRSYNQFLIDISKKYFTLKVPSQFMSLYWEMEWADPDHLNKNRGLSNSDYLSFKRMLHEAAVNAIETPL